MSEKIIPTFGLPTADKLVSLPQDNTPMEVVQSQTPTKLKEKDERMHIMKKGSYKVSTNKLEKQKQREKRIRLLRLLRKEDN